MLAVRIPPQTPTRRPRKPQTAPIWTSNPVNRRHAPKLNHVQNIENPMLCWPREMGWGHDGFYWAWKIRLCGSFLGDHWRNERNKGKNWCGSLHWMGSITAFWMSVKSFWMLCIDCPLLIPIIKSWFYKSGFASFLRTDYLQHLLCDSCKKIPNSVTQEQQNMKKNRVEVVTVQRCWHVGHL